MLAVIILAALVTALIYPSFIRSGLLSREEEKKDEEFKGNINCDSDCYMCGDLEKCKRETEKEG